MGAVTADQQKLVLNSFAHLLQNNIVTGDVVQWKQYDGEMDDRNGLQVIEQTSPKYKITRTENGVKDLTAGTDGSVFGSELFEVTGTFNANMGWGDFTRIKTIGDARESQALKGAAVSLAEQIDAYILNAITLASADWVGDGVADVGSWDSAMQAYTRAMENGVGDHDLSFVFNHTDERKLGDQVVKLPAPDGMASSTYRRGFRGEIGGVRTLFTNQLPILTNGTRSAVAGAINGAAQNKNYADVAKAGTVNGRSRTQSLTVDALGANATVKKGEVFTVPGVFAYDNRKQGPVTPARLQEFTVVADATANASGEATLIIFPAMIVPGSGTGDNININSAHATVTAAPADNALLTFKGAASATLSPRLLVQKEAAVVNTVPLIMPASDTAMRKKLTKLPLTVRMWQHSDFFTGAHGVRFDVAMNINIRERQRLVRVNGS